MRSRRGGTGFLAGGGPELSLGAREAQRGGTLCGHVHSRLPASGTFCRLRPQPVARGSSGQSCDTL